MIGIKASSIQIITGCNYPTYVASAETYATSGTNCIVDKPSGTTEGDIMIAIIHFNGNVTITPPTDWITIDEDDGVASGATVLLYYKIAGASEPSSYTWTSSVSNRHGAIIATFSGSFDSDPSNGTFSYDYQDNSASTDVAVASMTLTNGCAMVLYLSAYDQASGGVWTAPSEWTDACANAGGNNVYIGYKTFENSGSTGSVNYSIDETNSYKVSWLWSFVTNL